MEYKHVQVEFTCESSLNETELKEKIQSSGHITDLKYKGSSKMKAF